MADGFDLDTALDDLGARMRRAAPMPSAALMERVLGDAAAVAAERRSAAAPVAPEPQRPAPQAPVRGGAVVLGERLSPVWLGAAILALAAGLAIGIALGMSGSETEALGFGPDLPF